MDARVNTKALTCLSKIDGAKCCLLFENTNSNIQLYNIQKSATPIQKSVQKKSLSLGH